MKKVYFSDNVTVYNTFSKDEYSRESIDHVLYRKSYNRISNQEMNDIYTMLDIYKLYEMSVHKDSFHNNLYHTKPRN